MSADKSFIRPVDDDYWVPPWSRVLFSGDLFVAIPFLDQPYEELFDADGSGKHFVGQIAYGFGLLITPTCDMIDQKNLEIAHPYRLIVPVLPLELIAEAASLTPDVVGLIRRRDQPHTYMYLPALPNVFSESAACLYRASLIHEESLRETPRRIAQLGQEARRHLKIKLARYFARMDLERETVPLAELDEDKVAGDGPSPSPYDMDPARLPEDIPNW